MNVKCPYCGCSYSIDTDTLPKAIGDEKLGYGWWLHCCKCHKKWWLKSYSVSMTNSPHQLTAAKTEKIKKISELKRKRSWRRYRFSLYFVIIFGTFFIMLSTYNIHSIKDFIEKRTEHLLSTVLVKLKILNVQYLLEESPEDPTAAVISVSGKILNEDRNVLQISGVKVSVYDANNSVITTWIDSIGRGYIMSGESLDFATKGTVKKTNDQIKVDVSVLQ